MSKPTFTESQFLPRLIYLDSKLMMTAIFSALPGIIPKSVFSLLAVNSMTAAGFAVAMLPLALNVFLVLFASLEKIFNLVMPVDLKKADLLTATVFSIKAAFFMIFVLFHLAVNSMLVVHSMTIQAFQMVAVLNPSDLKNIYRVLFPIFKPTVRKDGRFFVIYPAAFL